MNRPTGSDADAPDGDPWAAFGYLVAGVAFYGALGWGLSVWLHADYWIPIGIVVGIGLGMYMVFARYRFRGPGSDLVSSEGKASSAGSAAGAETPPPSTAPPRSTESHDAVHRPASDDRGDTA